MDQRIEILEGLNPEQLAAVSHNEGPMLVVAGAGTGKTQVITRRIARLIVEGRAKPHEVLALTFTEKAAREMGERLYGLLGWDALQISVLTFHAFGGEILSRFASHVGRSIGGGLLNDTQKVLLLRQHMSEISLQYYGPQANMFEFLQGIVAYIGVLQNAGVTVGDYERYVAELRGEHGDLHPLDIDEQEDLLALFRLYEKIKTDTGTYDYQDQLQIPLHILQQKPNLAQRLAKEYRYILVDEYQDTNLLQDALLREFIGPDGNLFAVGDDDQAIYGFRGADIGNILAFANHFNLGRDGAAALIRNYRSGQQVLDGAYRLIRHNDPERLEVKLGLNKRLLALHDNSEVRQTAYETPRAEREGVADMIEQRLRGGEAASSVAVLSSTHAPLKALAKILKARSIPYALSASVNVFEQPELLSLWYLLRWIVFMTDDEAIGYVMMGPLFAWSASDYRRLSEAAKADMTSVEEQLINEQSDQALKLSNDLAEWRRLAKELPVSQLVFTIIFDGGMAEQWQRRAADTPRMPRVFEDLQRWLAQMQDFESVSYDVSLLNYMRTFPVPPLLESSEPMGDEGGVQLLTVHASKGLEFATVYLVGCTQRSWSNARGGGPVRKVPEALGHQADLPPEHEYRRLMYVAATRARDYLEVSYALHTEGGMKQTPSPFVSELFGDDAEPEAVINKTAGDDQLRRSVRSLYPLSQFAHESRLPFESEDGWIELSVTSLGNYEYCPFEFYVQNVLGIKQPIGPQISFGNTVHRVFERFFKERLAGHEPGLAALHEELDHSWTSRGYSSKTEAESDRKLAHTVLDRFWSRETTSERAVLGSEVSIRFELPEAKLRLKGKIDALMMLEDGVEIRDFKTSRTKTDVEKLTRSAKDNFQLRTYALAYEALKGEAPAHVTLDCVVTGVEGVASLSPTILRNHRLKLLQLAEKIRKREFSPNPSSVHECAAIKYFGTGDQEYME